MTDTLAIDLMPAQWFPDIELTELAVGERCIDIAGAGEWALQGDLVLFEGKGTLRLSLTEAPRVEIWNGETWQVLPEDFLEHATTVTHLQYDRTSDKVVVNARAGTSRPRFGWRVCSPVWSGCRRRKPESRGRGLHGCE